MTFNQSTVGQYGLITCDGKEILPPICDNILSVSANGMVLVRVNGKYGYYEVKE
ncbi:MAG: WG repeat-containing protein [Clostridiales bacterium]|nr:WG repeat-containing protein [Clostridiaceae bacterium]NLX83976.1 WG repeat-containing protein [Clostridiales bacterium]